MQLCESCGACRENEWSLCPFCRAPLTTIDTQTSNDNERFDALAAAGETSERQVLPSQIVDEEAETGHDNDLITAQDLAHLTGENGPAANGWDSPAPSAPAAPAEVNQGIDAPVSKVVVFPMIAVALAAVAFVAYSIVTASPTVRPDAVALIDGPTTTISAPTTTEPQAIEPGAVGVDLAEQAAWLCAGDQFSIARAEAPSLAIYNDLLVATRDGQDDWSAPADHVTLREPIPSLIGCLTTVDGGEIDRCPTSGTVISRRSVTWTYRVIQSSDGATLGRDQGTATDVLSCDELLAQAGDTDTAAWSPLPQERFDEAAAAYTTAPHPQEACSASSEDDGLAVEPPQFAQGASVHATFVGITDSDVTLPKGWRASDERPVDVVLCLETLSEPAEPVADNPSENALEAPAADDACGVSTRVHAMHRNGQSLGSWDYISSTCPAAGETVTPPDSWWVSVVGPALGYELEEAETEGS